MPIHRWFSIAEVEPGLSASTKRFRVLETNMTLDGPRTRVTDGEYSTREQAEQALRARPQALQDSPTQFTPSKDAAYLGDAVYVDRDNHGEFRVWISDGITKSEPIILEDETLRALILYARGKGFEV